ncbi:MAG: hypothetical protein WCG05_04885 [Alphaproteobacteria bacterium]
MFKKKIKTLLFLISLITLDSVGAATGQDWRELWNGIPPAQETLQAMYPHPAYRLEAGVLETGYCLEIWSIEDGVAEIKHQDSNMHLIEPGVFFCGEGQFHFSILSDRLSISDIIFHRDLDIVCPQLYLGIGQAIELQKKMRHVSCSMPQKRQ